MTSEEKLIEQKRLSVKLIREGKYSQAENILRELIDNYPNDAVLYNNLGVVHGKSNRKKESLKYFDKALEINPNFKLARKNRRVFGRRWYTQLLGLLGYAIFLFFIGLTAFNYFANKQSSATAGTNAHTTQSAPHVSSSTATAPSSPFKITNVSTDWLLQNDTFLEPEIQFDVVSTTNTNQSIYLEVHFINTKTKQDYGYQNDNVSLVGGTSYSEDLILNQEIVQSIAGNVPDGTSVKAVIETNNSNNQLIPIKSVIMSKTIGLSNILNDVNNSSIWK